MSRTKAAKKLCKNRHNGNERVENVWGERKLQNLLVIIILIFPKFSTFFFLPQKNKNFLLSFSPFFLLFIIFCRKWYHNIQMFKLFTCDLAFATILKSLENNEILGDLNEKNLNFRSIIFCFFYLKMLDLCWISILIRIFFFISFLEV